jgi:hypothetical protein
MCYKYVQRKWLITLSDGSVKGEKTQSQHLVFAHLIHNMSN